MQEQDWTLPEPTTEYYTETLLQSAKDFSDTEIGRASCRERVLW